MTVGRPIVDVCALCGDEGVFGVGWSIGDRSRVWCPPCTVKGKKATMRSEAIRPIDNKTADQVIREILFDLDGTAPAEVPYGKSPLTALMEEACPVCVLVGFDCGAHSD